MAVLTVAGQDVASQIRYRLSDTSLNPTFTDSELSNHVSWAVVEYSNHRPAIQLYSFTTAQGLYSYPAPTDLMNIVNHDYTNLGDLTFPDVDQLDWTYFIGQLRDDAIRFERDAFKGRWQNLTQGTIRIMQNSWLRLLPVPTGSYGVNLEYESQHKLVNSDFPTIPFSDVPIIINLAVVRCLEIEVDEMLRQGAWKAGQSEVKRQESVLLRRIEKIKDQVLAQLTSASMVSMQ